MKCKIMHTTFRSCGLEKQKNFLEAPMCPCGCGNYVNLVAKTKRELYDFIGATLHEYDCHYCAIFVLCKDGSAVMGVKQEDGITIYGIKENARREIADIEREFNFHCYGLLEQVDADSYKIIMD